MHKVFLAAAGACKELVSVQEAFRAAVARHTKSFGVYSICPPLGPGDAYSLLNMMSLVLIPGLATLINAPLPLPVKRHVIPPAPA